MTSGIWGQQVAAGHNRLLQKEVDIKECLETGRFGLLVTPPGPGKHLRILNSFAAGRRGLKTPITDILSSFLTLFCSWVVIGLFSCFSSCLSLLKSPPPSLLYPSPNSPPGGSYFRWIRLRWPWPKVRDGGKEKKKAQVSVQTLLTIFCPENEY